MDRRGSPLPLSLPLADAAATTRLGAWLAARLGAGDTLLLEGPIGAGKTHLARALIGTRLAAAGVVEEVPSPTYTLVQTYRVPGDSGALDIWHADLYRLGDPDELVELGLDEAFDTALCIVEWPERLGAFRPPNALTLRLEIAGDTRIAHLSASGPAASIIEALSAEGTSAPGDAPPQPVPLTRCLPGQAQDG